MCFERRVPIAEVEQQLEQSLGESRLLSKVRREVRCRGKASQEEVSSPTRGVMPGIFISHSQFLSSSVRHSHSHSLGEM